MAYPVRMRWGLLLFLLVAGCESATSPGQSDGFAEALSAMRPVYVDPGLFTRDEPPAIQTNCVPAGFGGYSCTSWR